MIRSQRDGIMWYTSDAVRRLGPGRGVAPDRQSNGIRVARPAGHDVPVHDDRCHELVRVVGTQQGAQQDTAEGSANVTEWG